MLNSLKIGSLKLQPLVISSKVQNVNKLSNGFIVNNSIIRDYSSKKPYSPDEFDTPSPYKQPGPRNYGYEVNIMTGGLLPRAGGKKHVLEKYKVKNNWSKEKALFGQNDYIDILGDKNVRPVDLIQGPEWVVGFQGNEFQRITRRLKFEGEKLREEEPIKHHNLRKRLWYLYKKYNQRRVSKYK